MLVAACFESLRSQSPEATATKSALETDPRGWVDILAPADLKGSSCVPVPVKGELGRAQWHVDTEQMVLICDRDGGHDLLLHEKPLGDAIFHFELRYTKDEWRAGDNSGACVRNSDLGAIRHRA